MYELMSKSKSLSDRYAFCLPSVLGASDWFKYKETTELT